MRLLVEGVGSTLSWAGDGYRKSLGIGGLTKK